MKLKHGVKIKNIKAGSLFEYNRGLRDRFEQQESMFTKSLFLYFLLENGLEIRNGFTRDVICLDFDYGARSFEEEVKHIEKMIKETSSTEQTEESLARLNRLNELLEEVNINELKYQKMSKEDIRTDFYVNEVDITYKGRKKDETISYKMLYRSTGKAKMGSCMFIRDSLYEKAYNFLYMGIDLPFDNSPIVEAGGYVPLVASSIEGTITIDPREILILEDVDRFFETNVVSIETDEKKHCVAKYLDRYSLKNTLFDGQALIDSSIFPSWGDGYILLRNHFCKMATFKSNIQLFFKDYFGDKYETAVVKDMFGQEHRVKDIKVITTDNAMKWIKFDVSYDYWCEKVNENKNIFGIVKTAHPSKLGNVQKMSYQMINSLDMETIDKVSEKTISYVEAMKEDDEIFMEYLKSNAGFSNSYEVLVALCEQDPTFMKSEYFRDVKKSAIYSYMKKVKCGKLIQEADNLVVVGSPYGMLLHAAGGNVDDDDTFCFEPGVIQCFTQRFEDGEYLAGFRSPFNSRNNMSHLHNVYHWKLLKYFDFGRQIMAVNCNGTDVCDRNNGMDFDSDSMFVTNNPYIVEHALYCYSHYPTIVNNIPKEKNKYSRTLENYARIDNNLAASRLAIGESSNLAQLSLTYSYNFSDQKYQDYVCILSVLAQVAIDSAKRRFDIDLNEEVSRIKKDLEIKTNGYPAFWKNLKPDFSNSKINKKLVCPMNYIATLKPKQYRMSDKPLPMSHFFRPFELEADRRKSKKVEELINKYSLDVYNSISVEERDTFLDMSNFDELIEDIRATNISSKYIGLFSWLINRAFMITSGVRSKASEIDSNLDKNKSILLKTLYKLDKESLLKCFSLNVKEDIDK